ncbi:MAG: HAMP domain-containing protein, partial [Rhodocyclaceae bacterium]|nr:HAMP domain-containing protein [Rhodocyclaceae bacterium]
MMRVPLQKRGPDTQALGQTAPAPRFSAFGIGRRLTGAVAALALMFLFFVGISIAVQLYVAHSAAHLEARNVAEALAAAGHDKVLDDAKHTQSIVSGLHAASGRDVFVVDRNLRILADSTEREIGTTFDDADGGAVAATLRDGQSRTFRERDGHGDQTLKQIVVPLRQDRLDPNSAIAGALILEYTQLERELMQTALTGTAALGGFGLVCMLLAVRFGMRLVGSIGRPLAELHAAVRAMAAGRRSTRAPVLANDEIGLVAAAFNLMAGELEASHAELAAHAERLQKHGDDLTAANRLLEREVRDRRLAEME